MPKTRWKVDIPYSKPDKKHGLPFPTLNPLKDAHPKVYFVTLELAESLGWVVPLDRLDQETNLVLYTREEMEEQAPHGFVFEDRLFGPTYRPR